MPTRKFDSSNLDQEQIQILQDLTHRRKIFDTYLVEKKIPLATCPGCGYPTLHERGAYEICDICNWEDDYQDDQEADEIWGGPNSDLSLTENRINIGNDLQNVARELAGKINDNPQEVLYILWRHNKAMHELLEYIPEGANQNDALFLKYIQSTKNLLEKLIKV